MDCGPASLRCFLDGAGVSVSYGRLREACQTDIDGTSIDTLEEVAVELGVDAEQVIVPAEHLLIAEARTLPAIVVISLPNGGNHVVVVWRLHGRFVQIMDPATGRRFKIAHRFLNEIYIHRFPVRGDAWRAWAGSHELTAPSRSRTGLAGARATPRSRGEAWSFGAAELSKGSPKANPRSSMVGPGVTCRPS